MAGSCAVRCNRQLQCHVALQCPGCARGNRPLHRTQSEAFYGSIFHDLGYAFRGSNRAILGKSSVVVVTMRFRSGRYDCSLHASLTDARRREQLSTQLFSCYRYQTSSTSSGTESDTGSAFVVFKFVSRTASVPQVGRR